MRSDNDSPEFQTTPYGATLPGDTHSRAGVAAAAPGAPGAPDRAARIEFFDRLADTWDDQVATPALLEKLRAAVAGLGIRPGAAVVDLGCGTGNLTALLAASVGGGGRVWAVDISARMLERARAKLPGAAHVEWVQADASTLPIPDGAVDVVVCLSVWPHFREPERVAAELYRILRPGGVAHVLHLDGREIINALHSGIGGVIARDLLPSAPELCAILRGAGFEIQVARDEPDHYLVSAARGNE